MRVLKMFSEAEWLKARREYVTGSDVAVLFGDSPYKNRTTLLAEKLSGTGDSIPDNLAMWFGREMETPNRLAFSKLTGIRTRGSHAFVVDDRSRLATTLDGFARFPDAGVIAKTPYWARDILQGAFPSKVSGLGLIELKNLSRMPAGIPAHYLHQVHAQLTVTGLPWAVFVAKVGSGTMKCFFIEREEKTCQKIRDAVDSFYDELESLQKEFGNE